MDIKFLDEVTLKSNNLVKSIRFADDELYMLKYIAYRKRKFSDYLKELLLQDLEKYISSRFNFIDRDEIITIVREVISNIDNNEISATVNYENEDIDLLNSMGIEKR